MEERLIKSLQLQAQALSASAASYDSSDDVCEMEARRMSNAINTLLHHQRSQKSILVELGLRDKFQLLSTAREILDGTQPSGIIETPMISLVHLQMRGRPKYVPALGNDSSSQHWLGFDAWWHEPIYQSDAGEKIDRCELIRVMRDKDGGAHVDPLLDKEAYNRLNKVGDPAMTVSWNGGPNHPPPFALEASVRQIAFELLFSMGFAGYIPTPIQPVTIFQRAARGY